MTDIVDVEQGTPPCRKSDPKNKIRDGRFIKELEQLTSLRAFLIAEAIPLQSQDADCANFGGLNLLRYDEDGRLPTVDEWQSVEVKTQNLFQHLSEPLRRKFLLGTIPRWVAYLPAGFIAVAIVALLIPLVAGGTDAYFPAYLVWLLALGALGSIAFIGMNALSVQQDATFDLNNSRLMAMRIVLGALFALVLAVPFGLPHFTAFLHDVRASGPTPVTAVTSAMTTQAIFLILPFVLGFSTTLVIMVLNRLVEAVQTFFGKSATTQTTSAASMIKVHSDGRTVAATEGAVMTRRSTTRSIAE